MRTVSPLPQRARKGACVYCGTSSSKRKYFDLNVFIEFEGALFLCENCVKEMGGELGFVTSEFHEGVKNNNQKLLHSNKMLRQRNEDQSDIIVTLCEERVVFAKEHATAVENARNKAIQETEARYTK